MKKIKVFLTLFLATALVSALGVSLFNTEVIHTVAVVGVAQIGFYAASALGYVQLPAGILGVYIGAPGGDSNQGAGVQVISTERSRSAYMTYRTNPEHAGKDITASYLRLETLISNGNNKLIFKTYVGDGTTQTPTEKRLERNDKFAITKLGFFLLAQPDGKSTGRLHSYPNLTDFGAAAPDLEAIFNGELSITINRKKIMPFFDMQSFLKVPETQQSGATNRDQRSLENLMVNLTPHIDIDGSGTNEIEIIYPSHNGFAGGTAAAGFKHYAVLYAKGFLISGGSANI
jgi:hypothetical protein